MDVLRRSESSERVQYSPGDLQQSVPSLSLILLLCDTSGDPLASIQRAGPVPHPVLLLLCINVY